MNPIKVGLASVAIIGALVGLAFMVGVLHLLEHTYRVDAVFTDAAGLRPGDSIRVAGVKAGRVEKISADRRTGTVVVRLLVNHGVELGRDATAEVALETLLGTKYVRITTKARGPHLEDLPRARRTIPRARTRTPFDVFELTTLSARRVEATDNEKLNQFIRQLADVTEGNGEQIRGLLRNIATVSEAINARDQQLADLFDRFDGITKLLDDKDEQLAALLDQSRTVLDVVARRSEELRRGLRGTDQVATELAHLLDVHRTQLDAILDTLHPTFAIVAKHQTELDSALTRLGPGVLGLSKATTHGPWADIFVRNIGPDVLSVIEDLLTQAVPQGAAP